MIRITNPGIKFPVEHAKSIQAHSYLSATWFREYTFRDLSSSSLQASLTEIPTQHQVHRHQNNSHGNNRNAQSQYEHSTQQEQLELAYVLHLTSLIDCLNMFGTTNLHGSGSTTKLNNSHNSYNAINGAHVSIKHTPLTTADNTQSHVMT